MKIPPRAAEAWLTSPNPQHRAVLLYGPDNGMVRLRAQRTVETQLGKGYDPMALVELSEMRLAGDPALLADELSAISLMTPKRVIILRDAGDKMTKIIEGAFSALNEATFLVVTAEELGTRSPLRAWFEQAANAAAIACYKDEMRDVQDVVRKAFDAAGIRVDRGIADYLAGQLGNDRGVTQQELEKIITFAGEEKELRLEDLRNLVEYNRDTGADDVVNAVADRNVQVLEVMLTQLLREGTQPVMVLRTLQRYFNRLYFIRGQMSSGQSAEQIIQSLRPPVFFKQIPHLTRHVQQWNSEQIVKALRLLVAAELACKTSDLPTVAASSRRLFQMTQVR